LRFFKRAQRSGGASKRGEKKSVLRIETEKGFVFLICGRRNGGRRPSIS
jgi:hypothetical protein